MRQFRIFCLAFFIMILALPLSAEADLIRLKQLGFQVPAVRSSAPPVMVNGPGDLLKLPAEGRVTLLFFWASWCPPCREQLPFLENLYLSLAPRGFSLAAVNMNEEKPFVEDYMESEGLQLPVYYYPDKNYLEAYSLKGIPASYLIDKKGMVAAVLTGSVDWDNPLIIRTIRELLDEPEQ